MKRDELRKELLDIVLVDEVSLSSTLAAGAGIQLRNRYTREEMMTERFQMLASARRLLMIVDVLNEAIDREE